MTVTIKSKYISIEETKIHYLETNPSIEKTIVLLHGARFKAQTWQKIGTLQEIAKNRYKVIALDLPGYGNSTTTSISQKDFLKKLLTHLNINKTIIVSPSMSGNYSLPYLITNPSILKAYVAVAPVGINKFISQLKNINIPTLAIWGNKDRVVPVSQADLLVETMPNTNKIILDNANHPCYLDKTQEFNSSLLKFFNIL